MRTEALEQRGEALCFSTGGPGCQRTHFEEERDHSPGFSSGTYPTVGGKNSQQPSGSGGRGSRAW